MTMHLVCSISYKIDLSLQMSPQESRHLFFFIFFLNNRYALSAVLIIYNELGFTATSDTK